MVIEETAIDVTFPNDIVRVLSLQPFIELAEPLQEPFPLSGNCAQRLTDAIPRIFEYAAAHRPHVILFPEFSIPGLDGVRRIVTSLSDPSVARPTVFIGGASGLLPNEFRELCGLPEVALVDDANAPARVHANQWVNTAVTCIKDDTGAVRVWVQPKLSPSWPEANCHHVSMFQGTVVRVFRARFGNDVPCRFLSLTCFDWVGRENGTAIPDALLGQLDAMGRRLGGPLDLQWAFVLQHNEAPNHATFLSATRRFLTNAAEAPFVRRNHTGVFMVCTASAKHPARGKPNSYGYSSMVFGPQAPFDSSGCPPTYATQPARLRQSEGLGTCRDVVFREMGECVHLSDVRVPNFVIADPTDRTPALTQAQEFPLNGPPVDPRIPNSSVPAVVKWANDELDDAPDFCTQYFAGLAVEPTLREVRDRIIEGYRRLPSQELAIKLDASCAPRSLERDPKTDPASDIDTGWETNERSSLHHVIQALSLVGTAAVVETAESRLHARSQEGVELAAIRGATHDQCVKALNRFAERTHSPILLVSRDDENAAYLPREGRPFADPRSAGVRLSDAHTLLHQARTGTPEQFRDFIAELLNVEERPII